MLRQLTLHIVDFLFPKDKEVYVLESLSPLDLLNALPPAQITADDTIALFSYADPRVRTLIWELKYRRNARVAKSLASILSDVARHELAERALAENFVNPLLVPMPISKKRLQERGWNQTEALCQEIVALDGEHFLEYAPLALTKERHTESQARTHSKKDRLTNVEHSMRVADAADIKGRNILLVDDVTTTGATLREARRVLKESGAKKILALTLAH